jgi:hypothetical protein
MASKFRNTLVYGSSLVALAGAAWGVRCAMRSPMFLLQVVEVADQPEGTDAAMKEAPVDAQIISQLAALPVGKINLFDLDLKPVEERILTHPWIREVRLQKHFPQTLSISVIFREPQALMQADNGALSYVDVDGKVFGQVNLMYQPDLPVIASSGAEHVPDALKVIHAWEQSDLSKIAQISLLQWDAERGFRALVSYPLEPSAGSSGTPARGRTYVDLGQEIDAPGTDPQFQRLSRVFQYLSSNRVMARQVWADSGKKIVVRTAHGS